MTVVAECYQVVPVICPAVLALYDVVYLKVCFASAFPALVSIPTPDILLDVLEPVLRSMLVPDTFDIRILDFVRIELRFLYHYT